MAIIRHGQPALTNVRKRYGIGNWIKPNSTGTVLAFPNDASHYDGSTQYVKRNGQLVGAVNSQKFIQSFWFRVEGTPGINRRIFDHSFRSPVIYANNDELQFIHQNSSNVQIAQAFLTAQDFVGTGFHHVIFSADLSVPEGQIYLDGAPASTNVFMLNNDTIDFTRGTAEFAARGGVEFFTGCLGEIYFNFGEYLDLDIPANLEKFIVAAPGGIAPGTIKVGTLVPADLGPTGARPTGTSPIIYLKNGGRDGLNQGDGGDFDEISGAPPKCIIPEP